LTFDNHGIAVVRSNAQFLTFGNIAARDASKREAFPMWHSYLLFREECKQRVNDEGMCVSYLL
jgi:hypothetical protein